MLAAAGAVATALLIAVALAFAYPNLPDISDLADYRPKLPLRVYSSEGALLGEFGEERRNLTPISEIPKVMTDAVLAIEDTRFFEHGGVDYKGMLRAVMANLGRVKSQGASTITMQVARNVYLSSEKTFTRKIYEILLTYKLEHLLSKNQILEIYMNQIYLGNRAYGFAAASETYFGKPLKSVSIAEAAMLAGLPKAPSTYNPISNPKRARMRQQLIIDRMEETGFIDAAQAAAARKEAVHIRTGQDSTRIHAEYVAEMARQLIYAQYGAEAYTRGLNVYTTLSASDQEAAYQALRRGIMNYERRQHYRGPEEFIELPQDAEGIDDAIDDALADHPDNGDVLSAVVLEVSKRKMIAVRGNGDTIEITGDGLKPVQSGLSDKAPPNIKLRRGAVIRVVRTDKGEWEATQLPFIYSAALEKGFTPATVINDGPLFFDSAFTGGQPWEPKNYDGKFDGPMTMRSALARSKNMVSIRILQAVGPRNAQEWVTRFGFDADKHLAYLTMALGAGSVTPMQMAVGYSVFANGGYRVNPWLISKITDFKGRVLAETQPIPTDQFPRAIEARNAFIMDSLLQEVTRSGTAARAQATLKRPDLYGKTGTTNDAWDAWFAGFQPSLAAVTWIGYDTPRNLGSRETGGGLSLPVWISFMDRALKGVPVMEPTVPAGVVNAGGEWFYQEYARNGVASLGLEDHAASASVLAPQDAPAPEERNKILELFRN